MANVELKLREGTRIGIIGGGPAGSFFAYLLLSATAQRGPKVEITIFDGKAFESIGPQSCNMCAGVLTGHLVKRLEEEGYDFPPSAIQRQVHGYVIHSRDSYARLDQAPDQVTYTVFRGVPFSEMAHERVSFDQFLLEQAVKRGARHVRANVSRVELPRSPHEPVRLALSGSSKAIHEVDLLVGAFGVNSHLARQLSFGYVPPKIWRAFQGEFAVSPEMITERYGNKVHIFLGDSRDIKFLALTPKRAHVTLTAIGPDVKRPMVEARLRQPDIAYFLPDSWRLSCHCHPALPVSAAQNPYADRVVMIGDAFISRYLKNGIESAYYTARFAAETILEHGFAAEDFRKHYEKRCWAKYGWDNRAGKVLFAINDFLSRHPLLANAHVQAARREQCLVSPEKRHHSEVLWGVFTGDRPYTRILLKCLHPTLHWGIARETAREATQAIPPWRRKGPSGAGGLLARRQRIYGRLEEGETVAIVGGGPSGCACALKLVAESQKLRRPIRVVLFERKDLRQHYNQCVGVLSPPLAQILETELGLTLPKELTKRRIKGYWLHGDRSAICLESHNNVGETVVTRRTLFDNFLMEKVREAGVEVVESRVSGVEFVQSGPTDEVRLYTESGYYHAKVVVAAFGLDDGMLRELESSTRWMHRYHRPRQSLKTFITKIDSTRETVDEMVGDYIHAFILSSFPAIEFAAVTPKGDHFIVNIAGKHVTSLDMDAFLSHPAVRCLLPPFDPQQIPYHQGGFPTAPSQAAFGDRYVVVGDATGWMRPFKGKGINVAILTGARAAESILQNGISREAFEQRYSSSCSELVGDYRYGAAFRRLTRWLKRTGLLDSVIEQAKENEVLRQALYDAVSGEATYREILTRLLSSAPLPRMAGRLLRDLFIRRGHTKAPSP